MSEIHCLSIHSSIIYFFCSQSKESPHSVLPLSLLAFVVSCEVLSYPSVPANDDDTLDSSNEPQSQIPQIDHMFRRHVNPKKQHEIKQLGKVNAVLHILYYIY